MTRPGRPTRAAGRLCVDRCVCFGQPFADLKAAAEASGATTVEALQAVVPFGLRCGLCRPYVRRMLAIGETAFHEILHDDGP